MVPNFESFFQAGFECSSHRRKDGLRLDLIKARPALVGQRDAEVAVVRLLEGDHGTDLPGFLGPRSPLAAVDQVLPKMERAQTSVAIAKQILGSAI